MTESQEQKLVRMVNQIADNIRHEGLDREAAADRVANHLRRFWAPSMRNMIIDYGERDGSELSETGRLAVRRLRE